MTGYTGFAPVVRAPRRGARTAGSPDDLALAEDVCSDVLESLPRRDQRRRGADYVRGLITTSGRKSIRNIASTCPGAASDQGLHHLVSGSTWSWGPVRRALREHVARAVGVHAWVPRPMTMPRAGRHAVGVRHTGGAAAGQHAIGLWAVSTDLVTPVQWRLRLDADWLDDPERRRSASIPDELREESDTEAVAAVCAAAGPGHRTAAPVVVDAAGLDPAALLRALRRTRRPVVARIGPDTLLRAGDPTAATGAAEVEAGRLLAATAVPRGVPGPDGAIDEWVSAVRVRPRSPVRPVGSPRGAGTLLLVGSGRVGLRGPSSLWLTDRVDERPDEVLRLGRALTDVEAREHAGTAAAAGVGHYGGRSYQAWHRHTTLASIAHAVGELAGSVPGRTGAAAA